MSPNNYLMLAKNIKDYLIEYLSSKSIINYVEQKYDELSEILSLKDADLRAIGKEAKEKGKNTLIVNDDVFKFLENYGFEIISLDEKTLNESTLNLVKTNFEKEEYDTIFILDNNYTEEINNLIDEYEIKTISINSMTVFNENDDDYLMEMQQFIDEIRNLCLTV